MIEDHWTSLERLAKASIADNDNPCIFAATQSLADFNEHANPVTVLELITAARQGRGGDEAAEQRSAQKPSSQPAGELREKVAVICARARGIQNGAKPGDYRTADAILALPELAALQARETET